VKYEVNIELMRHTILAFENEFRRDPLFDGIVDVK